MRNFGQEDLAPIATTKPVNNNDVRFDVLAVLKEAQASRNYHMHKWIADKIEAIKAKRKINAAKEALYQMTDRELRDIGLTRGEIDRAVEGRLNEVASTAPREGIMKRLVRRFIEAQKARAAYIQLSAMSARELADIGLTRSDIEAAVTGRLQVRANDNLIEAAHLNGHRKAS